MEQSDRFRKKTRSLMTLKCDILNFIASISVHRCSEGRSW